MGLLDRHRPVNRFPCFVLSLCSIGVEAPGQSIDPATRLPKTIDLHRCHDPVLPGRVYLSGNYLFHVRD